MTVVLQRFAIIAALAAQSAVVCAATTDTEYPAKPIRLLVGFPPGGNPTMTRMGLAGYAASATVAAPAGAEIAASNPGTTQHASD